MPFWTSNTDQNVYTPLDIPTPNPDTYAAARLKYVNGVLQGISDTGGNVVVPKQVSVLQFGAVGDGVADDTAAIRLAINQSQGKRIYFPPGRYRFAGNDPEQLGDKTIVCGAGRRSTIIISTAAAPPSLFYCQGTGSGVESMGFEAEVTQTGGCYVYLGGPESYISDFFMTGDYRGVIMTGNVSQIRHGRFQDRATSGIGIDVGGGDNSQSIHNVLMGAQTPANIATAGIRVRNSVALTISNVSVIQQGNGILIDPTSSSENVLNMFVNQCFFDNCSTPINISPTGTASVQRLYFTDVWASSGTNGVAISAGASANVKGVHFKNLQANLSTGSGVTCGASNVSELTIDGGTVAGNAYGMYFNGGIPNLQILNVNIGAFDNFSANTNAGITFAGSTFTNAQIVGNTITGNGSAISGDSWIGSGSVVKDNIGYNPVGITTPTVGGSPYTYTAGPYHESVYVSGGTVSAIAIGGSTVFTSTDKVVFLGPGQSVVITYSGAPTVRSWRH